VEQLLSSPQVWIDSIHPGDRERVLSAAVSDALVGNDSCEYRILRPDGTIRWVYDRAYPIRNAKGEIYRLAGVIEDITDRRKPPGG
jgi:PAS domain S-box-containing protein